MKGTYLLAYLCVFFCFCYFLFLFCFVFSLKDHGVKGERTQWKWLSMHFISEVHSTFSSLSINTSVPQFLFPLRKQTTPKNIAVVSPMLELPNSRIHSLNKLYCRQMLGYRNTVMVRTCSLPCRNPQFSIVYIYMERDVVSAKIKLRR